MRTFPKEERLSAKRIGSFLADFVCRKMTRPMHWIERTSDVNWKSAGFEENSRSVLRTYRLREIWVVWSTSGAFCFKLEDLKKVWSWKKSMSSIFYLEIFNSYLFFYQSASWETRFQMVALFDFEFLRYRKNQEPLNPSLQIRKYRFRAYCLNS